MKKLHAAFIFACLLPAFAPAGTPDYIEYHRQVIAAEELSADEKFAEALQIYEKLFDSYDFVFLRDCKVAVQLALRTGEDSKVWNILWLGIRHGWTLRQLKKESYLQAVRSDSRWELLEGHYDSLFSIYQQRLDQALAKEVRRMFAKDQWKALGALFCFSSEAQDRYAEKKFAPNNARQVVRLQEILTERGYPSEKLVGNNLWATTILCHHNSISQSYTRQDTLYPAIQPLLKQALKRGEVSPYEYAFIENWYITVGSGHSRRSYGYLDPLTEEELKRANQMRAEVGLRSVETRNRLIEVQEKTGLNFYLPDRPQPNGEIEIVQEGE